MGLGLDEARALLEEGQTFTNAIGERRAQLFLSMAYSRAILSAGEVAGSLEVAFQNRRAALELTDTALQSNAWMILVDALGNAERFPEVLREADEGIARFPRHIPSEDWLVGFNPYSLLSFWRGISLNWTGRIPEGLEELGRCRRTAEEDHTPVMAGFATGYAAEFYYHAHDADRALASALQADEICRRLGQPPATVANVHDAFACAHLAAGRVADAIESAQAALIIRSHVEKQIAGVSATLLAEAILQTGDLSAAQAAAQEATAICRRTLRMTYEAVAHGVIARVLMRRDGAAARVAVEDELASAGDLIERSGARTLAPALCEWRAELAGVLGNDDERVRLLREAYEGYAKIGAPGHAERLAKEFDL